MVDFVVGGNSYVEKAPDVQKNIGTHVIQFAFEFEGTRHFFSRNTSEYLSVDLCDENYNITSKITLNEFCEWLKQQYGMNQAGLTFRAAVTRYARVYQKDNLNEKRPLEANKNEPDRDAVLVLLKLFGKYKDIMDAKSISEEANKKFQTYRNGIKYEFIPTISSKRERKKKELELNEQKLRRDNISDPEILAGKTAEVAMRIADLKCELQRLRATLTRTQSRIARVRTNMNEGEISYCEDFKEFASYFPNADMRKLSEVEQFHIRLSSILKDEMVEEKRSAEDEAHGIEAAIQKVETELGTYDVPIGISKKVLTDFAAADRRVHEIEEQIKNFDEIDRLKCESDEYKKRYVSLMKNDLIDLQTSISIKMKELNDFIYGENRKAPVISLESNSYTFETPDDSGTGTSYKSLVVFDLAILCLTNLPVLVHDSVLLKNIGDEPMEKILELYSSADKQIFIALDKSDSYSPLASEILEGKAVLRLSNNGSELFGRSWNRIKSA